MTNSWDIYPAWKITDNGEEGYVQVVHAATAADALLDYAKEYGYDHEPDYGEWFEVERCEAMDSLEPTTYNCMVMGVIRELEDGCDVCGATIYAEPADDNTFMIYAMDKEYGQRGVPVIKGDGDLLFCSEVCLKEYHAWHESIASSSSAPPF